jgi:SAM-dependent methyltransferase
MAQGYARARPPLHARIVDRARELLGLRAAVHAALDLGCGSGLSTLPLLRAAARVVGVDPVQEMVTCARSIAPGARFAAARGEALPFRSGSVDFVTAAGSLNYGDPPVVLREAARVLAPGGAVCVYDFGQGRKFRDGPALESWFAEFVRRFPAPASEAIALDPEILVGMAGDLDVTAAERFELGAPFALAAYRDYLMTETNIAAAIRRGEVETEIRDWLERSLATVFGGASREVMFAGYIVCLR